MTLRMKRSTTLGACLVGLSLLVAGCESPSNMETEQNGYRGTGMETVKNTEYEALKAAMNTVPDPLYPPVEPASDAPMATDLYENVQVLTDLKAEEFDRLMAHITEWVAPADEGCAYCHDLEAGFADEGKYTKHVARSMLLMTRAINADWGDHVGNVGVTCYTCHRGNALPAEYWFAAEPAKKLGVGYRAGQNRASPSVAYASLPEDPFSKYLLSDDPIRVNSPTALPSGQAPEGGIKNTEHTYALMAHMSDGLGVNCTYCHNSRVFASWEESPPARATAWYGIRMVRDLNNDWMVPLTDTFADAPAGRLGPTGDVGKIYCATCHIGANKPLLGAPMAKDYPEIWGGRSLSADAVPIDHKDRVARAMAEAALAHAKVTSVTTTEDTSETESDSAGLSEPGDR